MVKVSFFVEVGLGGLSVSVSAATAAELIEKIENAYVHWGIYCDDYVSGTIDYFSYCLEKDGKVVCEGTYDNIVETLKRME